MKYITYAKVKINYSCILTALNFRCSYDRNFELLECLKKVFYNMHTGGNTLP